MLVRVPDWVLVESGRHRPEAGSHLRSVAVRLQGQIAAVRGETPDGITEVALVGSVANRRTIYALTGTVSDPRDVWTKTKRWGRSEHSGAELVLTIGTDRFQVQFDGSASDVGPGSRATATGELVLVADYEWESFDLTDIRTDWYVTRVINLPDGDIQVDLARPAGV
jgi:hypothetical protein